LQEINNTLTAGRQCGKPELQENNNTLPAGSSVRQARTAGEKQKKYILWTAGICPITEIL